MYEQEPTREPLPGTEPEAPAGPDGRGGTGTGTRNPVRCRLCHRPLTGADSRRTGLGPDCDAKLHPTGPDIRTRRHEVEQDTLPGL